MKKLIIAALAVLSFNASFGAVGDVTITNGEIQVETVAEYTDTSMGFVGGSLSGTYDTNIYNNEITIQGYGTLVFVHSGGGVWTSSAGVEIGGVNANGISTSGHVVTSFNNGLDSDLQHWTYEETSSEVWEQTVGGTKVKDQTWVDSVVSGSADSLNVSIYDAGSDSGSIPVVIPAVLVTIATVADLTSAIANVPSGTETGAVLASSSLMGSTITISDSEGNSESINLGSYTGGATYANIPASSSPWGVELDAPQVVGGTGIFTTVEQMINDTFKYQAKYVDGKQDYKIGQNKSAIEGINTSDITLKFVKIDGEWVDGSNGDIDAANLGQVDWVFKQKINEDNKEVSNTTLENLNAGMDTDLVRNGYTAQTWETINSDYVYDINVPGSLKVDHGAILSDHQDILANHESRISALEAEVAALKAEKATVIEQITKVYKQENGDRILVNYDAFTGNMIDVPRKLNFFEFSTPIYSADAVVWHWDADLGKSILMKRSDIIK